MPSAEPGVGDVVMPGDRFFLTVSAKGKIVLGPGLRPSSESAAKASPDTSVDNDAMETLKENKRPVSCTKCGILRFRPPNAFWVDSHQRRYVAAVGDSVVGLVIAKVGVEFFRVDVGASQPAVLSAFAFEGATKKNRPNVKVGDLLFCRISVDDKDRETEISCVDAFGKAAGMGPLEGGTMIQVSLNCVRKLTSKDCVLLKLLGRRLSFEVACGVNGRIWVKATTVKNTIAISNAMVNAEFMNNEQIKVMTKTFLDANPTEENEESARTENGS